MQGFALFSRDLRWCALDTSHITGYSPQKTWYRIGQPKNRSAKEALNRRKIMRKARSKKKRPILTAQRKIVTGNHRNSRSVADR